MSKSTKVTTELKRQFQLAKRRNPKFSLRAYAKKIGVSPATMTRILEKNKKLSEKMITQILRSSHLSEEFKREIANSESDPFSDVTKNHDFKPFLDHWYYAAVASLAEIKEFKDDPAWIARRLGIQLKQASSALQFLKRVGIIVQVGPKKFETRDVSFTSYGPKDQVDMNLVDKTQRVKDFLLENDIDLYPLSHVSSMVQSIDPKYIPEARKKIHSFRRSLSRYLDQGKKEEVYMLNIQLIPISDKKVKA